MSSESKAIHVKIFCESCGAVLLKQRVEIPDQFDIKNPLRCYVGLSVDPWCEVCLGKKEDFERSVLNGEGN